MWFLVLIARKDYCISMFYLCTMFYSQTRCTSKLHFHSHFKYAHGCFQGRPLTESVIQYFLFVILLSKSFIHRELSNCHSCCMLLFNFCSISKFSIFEVCQVFPEGYLNVYGFRNMWCRKCMSIFWKMWRLVWKYFSLVML